MVDAITGTINAGQVITEISILSLIWQATLVVKIVMLLLVSASIWSWTIIIEKFMIFNKIELKSERFEKAFWSGQLLEQLFERVKQRADHPLARIFVSSIEEWKKQNFRKNSEPVSHLSLGIKDRLHQTMEVTKNRELSKLEKNLVFLSTTASIAPFIGLFGTVWGIMHSFQSISASKNATLAVVAPGIAEALLATAIGLVTAIPALVFYNIFASKLNKLTCRIEDFSFELSKLLSHESDNN